MAVPGECASRLFGELFHEGDGAGGNGGATGGSPMAVNDLHSGVSPMNGPVHGLFDLLPGGFPAFAGMGNVHLKEAEK